MIPPRHPTSFPRRDFLAALAAVPFWAPLNARRLRPAIQLYTVRELLRHDLDGTLQALARIGYREVEIAWLDGRTPAEYRAALDRAGLRAVAGHIELAGLTDRIPATIADARTLGYRRAIISWLPREWHTRPRYTELAALLNSAGRRLRQSGLRVGYHNHGLEGTPLAADSGPGSETGFDLLLGQTDPELVAFELDVYWARQGGTDPFDLLRRHPDRFRLMHIKDGDDSGAMVDIGRGVTDWPALLPVARRAGVRHFIAESDDAPDPLGFARASFDYLQTIRL